MRPLQDHLLVELEEVRKEYGGILIPDTAKEQVRFGKVLSVGPGVYLPSGKRRPMGVKPGDRICFHHAHLQTGQGYKLKEQLGEGLGLLRELDVFFVIEGEVEVTI
jgi:co-chaperonin GroES (HSP10)